MDPKVCQLKKVLDFHEIKWRRSDKVLFIMVLYSLLMIGDVRELWRGAEPRLQVRSVTMVKEMQYLQGPVKGDSDNSII